MELSERKKKVLRSIVDLYIRTAEPVGSKAIAELPDMKYSSATIRNEMAELALLAEDSRTIRALSKDVALRSYPNLFE